MPLEFGARGGIVPLEFGELSLQSLSLGLHFRKGRGQRLQALLERYERSACGVFPVEACRRRRGGRSARDCAGAVLVPGACFSLSDQGFPPARYRGSPGGLSLARLEWIFQSAGHRVEPPEFERLACKMGSKRESTSAHPRVG
jgi:hypothetical protein